MARLISARAYDADDAGPGYGEYVESYGYDALARPVKTTLPKKVADTAAYTHRVFDALGRQTLVSLPTNQADPTLLGSAEKTTTSYWDTGEIYSSTDGANGLTVRYGYTAEGWQTERLPDTVSAPGVIDYGRAMYWDYLPDGLLRAVRDLVGQREIFNYDANGNQTLAVEASGITTAPQSPLRIEQSFDGFDQLTKVRVPKEGQSGSTRRPALPTTCTAARRSSSTARSRTPKGPRPRPDASTATSSTTSINRPRRPTTTGRVARRPTTSRSPTPTRRPGSSPHARCPSTRAAGCRSRSGSRPTSRTGS